jgi:transposase
METAATPCPACGGELHPVAWAGFVPLAVRPLRSRFGGAQKLQPWTCTTCGFTACFAPAPAALGSD